MNTAPNGSGAPVSLKPFVRIVEQPAKCAIRFRYECEGRSAGSIPGVNSTAENKSFPTIQVCNYRGKAVVVVSCVTKDPPYRPHPHNLVGKEGCKKGVCTIVIDNNAEMTCTFTSLGIQCVKRKDIEESLKLREVIKVDPFRTGFNHRSQASSIDLNVVRLCFQVFIEGPEKGKFTVQLPPIVSEPIYDKKAMAELIITKLSHYAAPCTGGKEIILLCDRVAKDDIQVRFFHETVDCALIWEAYGEFLPNDVHKQVAISLRTPKYYDESIQQPVTIQIQLRRPSDGCTSLSRSFQLTPRELDPDGLVRKRHKRLKEENYDLLQEYIQLASGPSSSAGQMSSAKRSASVGFTANKTPGSPKKDLVHQLFQQQQQQQQQQASTSAAIPSSSRSPFVYGPPQSTPVLAQQSTIVQSNEPSNSPKSASPSSQFIPIHHPAPSFMTYSELAGTDPYARPPSAQGGPGGSSSPSSVYISSGHPGKPRTPNHLATAAFASPEMASNMVYTVAPPPGSSPNPYQLYQQPQPSPNPSIASYSSGVPSPGQPVALQSAAYSMGAQMEQNNNCNLQQAEMPNEVVERFDSLDIDSSELIPDLEFNSNTMLNLMMDTSSGLSLSDSFSDITNGNPGEIKMTKSYNNGDAYSANRPNSRPKLKLQMGGSNPALTHTDNLDTPTIDMVTCGLMNANSQVPAVDPLLSVLDVDNNNFSLN